MISNKNKKNFLLILFLLSLFAVSVNAECNAEEAKVVVEQETFVQKTKNILTDHPFITGGVVSAFLTTGIILGIQNFILKKEVIINPPDKCVKCEKLFKVFKPSIDDREKFSEAYDEIEKIYDQIENVKLEFSEDEEEAFLNKIEKYKQNEEQTYRNEIRKINDKLNNENGDGCCIGGGVDNFPTLNTIINNPEMCSIKDKWDKKQSFLKYLKKQKKNIFDMSNGRKEMKQFKALVIFAFCCISDDSDKKNI